MTGLPPPSASTTATALHARPPGERSDPPGGFGSSACAVPPRTGLRSLTPVRSGAAAVFLLAGSMPLRPRMRRRIVDRGGFRAPGYPAGNLGVSPECVAPSAVVAQLRLSHSDAEGLVTSLERPRRCRRRTAGHARDDVRPGMRRPAIPSPERRPCRTRGGCARDGHDRLWHPFPDPRRPGSSPSVTLSAWASRSPAAGKRPAPTRGQAPGHAARLMEPPRSCHAILFRS